MLQIIISLGLMLISIALLQLVLPGFRKQDKAARVAELLSQSKAELARSEQNTFLLHMEQRLQNKKWIDFILGVERRTQYEKLERKESYEFYLAKLFLQSVGLSASTFIFYVSYPGIITLILPFIAFVAMIWSSLDQLNKLVSRREKLILQELPSLFEKMIIALEVGRPLENIMESMAKSKETSNPMFANLLKRLVSDSHSYTLPVALQTFADSISLPIVYNFVSIVNIIREKGFHEAEQDLNSLQQDIRSLKRVMVRERNKNKPAKLFIFTGVGIGVGIICMFFMSAKLIGIINFL